jgi:RNA polymerase sigma factor (sigma-70 family)
MAYGMEKKQLNALPDKEQLVTSWFEQYANSFLKYGLQIKNDRELVKDVIQELFAGIWHSSENIGDIKSAKNYLFISFRRKLFKAIESEKKRQSVGTVNVIDETVPSNLELAVEREESHQLSSSIMQMVATLSQRQREIIFLRFYEELDLTEIGEIMGLNYQATRNLLYKAIKNLRQEASHHQTLRNIPLHLLLISFVGFLK